MGKPIKSYLPVDNRARTVTPPKPTEKQSFAAALQQIFDLIFSFLKIGLVAAFAMWIYAHQDFAQQWLWSLSGGEVLGFKFAREVIDRETATLEAAISKDYGFNNEAVKSALVRASRQAPAIVNSRVLWVDDKPLGNAPISDLLKKLKIIVVNATSTKEALDAMRVSPFDIIVTNVWRPNDKEYAERALTLCSVHYFDFPDEQTAAQSNGADDLRVMTPDTARVQALFRFNQNENQRPPAGFALADIVLSSPGTSESLPDVIFFSAVNAEVARPLCGYTITNRVDVLLNAIVSLLAQRHSDALARKPWEPEKTAEQPKPKTKA